MGPLLYQLVSPTLDGMYKEMELEAEVAGSALVLIVPPTENGFRFMSQCRAYPCCVTAVYSAAQALVARESGARYVAVYMNRATRLLGNGLKLVKDISEVLRQSQTEIIAASVKSADEACAALLAGVQHLTLPYQVLMSPCTHPLSEQTIGEFESSGIGLTS